MVIGNNEHVQKYDITWWMLVLCCGIGYINIFLSVQVTGDGLKTV